MRRKETYLKFVLFFGDIFLIYLALLLTLALRYKDFSLLPGPQTRVFIFHFSFIYIIWFLLLFILDFYEIPPFKKISNFLSSLTIFSFLAGSLGAIYFYLQPLLIFTPKTILFLNVFIFSILILFWRLIINYLLHLKNFKEKIGIIGFRPELQEILFSQHFKDIYEIIVFLNPTLFFSGEEVKFSNLVRYGTVNNIFDFKKIIEKEKVSSVVFALDFRENKELASQIFSNLPLKLNYISFSDFYESLTKKVPLEALNEVWFLENLSRAERKIDSLFKRLFDIFFSFFGFLIVVILFPFISLAIRIDSQGPIFYTQKRTGKEGKIFTVYKFRTMKENPNQKEEVWREKKENQITMVGKVLRKIHLDEFPQFWSILRGDLSFVGPRPEWVELAKIFEKEIPFYSQRYLIKPGFTGWAQINFPASLSVREAKEKFEYDLYYIKNRSFFLDLAIILKTIRIIFR